MAQWRAVSARPYRGDCLGDGRVGCLVVADERKTDAREQREQYAGLLGERHLHVAAKVDIERRP